MHMDRAIFDLEATVEATSLYILLCALLDQGESLTLDRARVQWNGNGDNLVRAAQELMDRNVLEEMRPLENNKPLRMQPRDKWH